MEPDTTTTAPINSSAELLSPGDAAAIRRYQLLPYCSRGPVSQRSYQRRRSDRQVPCDSCTPPDCPTCGDAREGPSPHDVTSAKASPYRRLSSVVRQTPSPAPLPAASAMERHQFRVRCRRDRMSTGWFRRWRRRGRPLGSPLALPAGRIRLDPGITRCDDPSSPECPTPSRAVRSTHERRPLRADRAARLSR